MAVKFGKKFEVVCKLPHAGEQLSFAMESVQLTPRFFVSPITVAVSVIGAVPASTVVNAPVTLTASAGVLAAPEELLHAQHHTSTTKLTNAER